MPFGEVGNIKAIGSRVRRFMSRASVASRISVLGYRTEAGARISAEIGPRSHLPGIPAVPSTRNEKTAFRRSIYKHLISLEKRGAGEANRTPVWASATVHGKASLPINYKLTDTITLTTVPEVDEEQPG